MFTQDLYDYDLLLIYALKQKHHSSLFLFKIRFVSSFSFLLQFRIVCSIVSLIYLVHIHN